MSTIKKDPKIAAIETVHAALEPLDPDSRRKVLASVYALLEIPGPQLPELAKASEGAKTGSPPSGEVPGGGQGGRPMGLVELVKEKQATTNAQRIAAFAYYREKYRNQPKFSPDDLKQYFETIHESPPKWYTRDFGEAVKKGWIHEEGENSYITSRGIEAVEGGFPGERKYSAKPGPRVRRRKPKKQTRK